MFYVQRDNDGHLIRVEEAPFPEMNGELAPDSPEAVVWQNSLRQLRQSDLEMVRVLEDLIQVLMRKGVIAITDFPPAAQLKLINRTQVRETMLGGLNKLLNDEDDRMF